MIRTGPLPRIAAIGALACTALLSARGCGGVTDSRVAARDQATTATCTAYQRCGQIGSASTDAYPDYSSCVTVWEGKWESLWPASTCQGKIVEANLTVCLNAIGGTDCSSLLDILTTLYVKCSAASVCGAGTTDAAAD